jgi:NADPH2 dehydrogenase
VIINLLLIEMRMPDPLPTFAEVVKRIRVGYPDFAYLHVIEPTTHYRPDGESGKGDDSDKLLRDIWGDGAYIANSDFERDSAIETVEKEGGLVSFARHFISNVSKCFLCLSRRRDADLS